jgi:hypothetical protein
MEFTFGMSTRRHFSKLAQGAYRRARISAAEDPVTANIMAGSQNLRGGMIPLRRPAWATILCCCPLFMSFIHPSSFLA